MRRGKGAAAESDIERGRVPSNVLAGPERKAAEKNEGGQEAMQTLRCKKETGEQKKKIKTE